MRRVIFSLAALPLLTLSAFALLTAISFLELRGQKRAETEEEKPEPVSRAVVERYRAESRELAAIRSEARKDLSVEKLLSALDTKDQAKVPAARTLLSWLRTLQQRDEQAAEELLCGLLRRWKPEAGEKKKVDRRQAALRQLLIQSCLGVTETPTLSEEDRTRLFAVLTEALKSYQRVAGALLLVVSRIGEAGDIPRVRELAEGVKSRQLAVQLRDVLENLERRTLAMHQSGGDEHAGD